LGSGSGSGSGRGSFLSPALLALPGSVAVDLPRSVPSAAPPPPPIPSTRRKKSLFRRRLRTSPERNLAAWSKFEKESLL
jgi:hypothetical protein